MYHVGGSQIVLEVPGLLQCGQAGPVTSSPAWMLQPCENDRSRFWGSRHAVLLNRRHTYITSCVLLSGYADRSPLLEGLPPSSEPRATRAVPLREMCGCIGFCPQWKMLLEARRLRLQHDLKFRRTDRFVRLIRLEMLVVALRFRNAGHNRRCPVQSFAKSGRSACTRSSYVFRKEQHIVQ